jgi:hypothetical protein
MTFATVWRTRVPEASRLTWSLSDGEDHPMARAGEFDALHRMHALSGGIVGVDRGEVVDTREVVAA